MLVEVYSLLTTHYLLLTTYCAAHQMLVEVCFAIAEQQLWVFLLACFLCIYCAGPLMLLWAGTLQGRCVPADTFNSTSDLPASNGTHEQQAAASLTVAGQSFERVCSLQGGRGRICDAGYTCANSGLNPLYNHRGFDSLGLAMLTFVQCLTLDGWTTILYQLWDGNSAHVVIPLVPMTFVGAYGTLSLSLTVVVVQVSRRLQAQEKRSLHASRQEAYQYARRLRIRRREEQEVTLFPSFHRMSDWFASAFAEWRRRLKRAARLSPLKGPPRAHRLRWKLFRFISAPRLALTAEEEDLEDDEEELPEELDAKRLRISFFDRVMLILILANAAMLGVQYHGMPKSTERALDRVNLASALRYSSNLSCPTHVRAHSVTGLRVCVQ